MRPRWLVVFGLVVLATGMFQLSSLNLETNFGTFVYTWMISRGGLGFLFVPINVMAFNFIPEGERQNNASGLINLARRDIGGSIGISAVTTMQNRDQPETPRHAGRTFKPIQSGLPACVAGAGRHFAGSTRRGTPYRRLHRRAPCLYSRTSQAIRDACLRGRVLAARRYVHSNDPRLCF